MEDVQASATVGRHVVILAHPGPDSFNHAIARAYRDAVRWAGQEAVLRDLYAIGFNPVLQANERPGPDHLHPLRDVGDEIEIIRRSDVFVLIYPIWFGSAPAMLKGYVDRVLGWGVVPDAMRQGSPTKLSGGKALVSFTTSATTDRWLQEQGQPAAIAALDRYLAHGFGMRSERHIHFDSITDALPESEAHRHLQEVKDSARRLCEQIADEAQAGSGVLAEAQF